MFFNRVQNSTKQFYDPKVEVVKSFEIEKNHYFL